MAMNAAHAPTVPTTATRSPVVCLLAVRPNRCVHSPPAHTRNAAQIMFGTRGTIEMLSMFSEMQRPVPTLDMIVMITDWAVPAAPKVRSLLDRSGIHWVDWGHRRNPMGLPGAIAAQIRSLR